MADIGRTLLVVGGVLFLVGLVLTVGARIPGLGRLPGDIVYRKGNFTFYFPIVTSLLLSVLLADQAGQEVADIERKVDRDVLAVIERSTSPAKKK